MAVAPVSAHDEVYDFLVSSPTPEQIVTFRPSVETQQRVRQLLAANREGTLTPEERVELDEYGKVEHLMRMLKARARLKLDVS